MRLALMQKRRSPWWRISVPILCALIPFYLVVEIMELDGTDDEDGEVEALCENEEASTQVTKGGDGPLLTPEGSHSKASLNSLVASFSRLRRGLPPPGLDLSVAFARPPSALLVVGARQHRQPSLPSVQILLPLILPNSRLSETVAP